MASERGKLVLLGAIVLTFVGVVWWEMTRDDGRATTPSARAAAGAAPRGQAVAGESRALVPAVALPALGEAGAEPVDTGRDPFRFGAAAGGGGRAAGAGGSDGRTPPAPVAPAGPVAAETPGGPPPPPPIQLRYIGTAKQGAGGRQLAVLRDDRGIYYGGEGDVIEGRYRILRISADSVDLAYVDGRGRRTIPLTGGQ